MLLFNTRMGPHPGKLKLRWGGPYWVVERYGDGTFRLGTVQGELLQKPVNGFRLRPYTGRMPPYPFPAPLTEPIITSACVAISVEKPMMGNLQTHVWNKLHHTEQRWGLSLASPTEEAAMQTTETSEWGFYYDDGTLDRCMQTRRSPGNTKGNLEAIGSLFQTLCLPELKPQSSSSLIYPLIAMVVFHLITPLHIEDEAVQRWLIRTCLVEFAGLPWAMMHVHPSAHDILA